MAGGLPWNGTHLGSITDDDILSVFMIKKFRYWKLDVCGIEITAMYRTMKSFVPCIIDEAKSLFGLPKLGTHSVRYKSKLYILIRVEITDDGDIVQELLLNDTDDSHSNNEFFAQLVRETYVFRDTFAISKTYDSSISCRPVTTVSGSYLQPFSLVEATMGENTGCILPGTVMERWFNEDNMPADVLQSMLKVRSRQDLQRTIARIRTGLRQIVNNIAPDYTRVDTIVIRRLTSRLCNKISEITAKTKKETDTINVVRLTKTVSMTPILTEPATEIVSTKSDLADTCGNFEKLQKVLVSGIDALTPEEREQLLKLLSAGSDSSEREQPKYRLSFRS